MGYKKNSAFLNIFFHLVVIFFLFEGALANTGDMSDSESTLDVDITSSKSEEGHHVKEVTASLSGNKLKTKTSLFLDDDVNVVSGTFALKMVDDDYAFDINSGIYLNRNFFGEKTIGSLGVSYTRMFLGDEFGGVNNYRGFRKIDGKIQTAGLLKLNLTYGWYSKLGETRFTYRCLHDKIQLTESKREAADEHGFCIAHAVHFANLLLKSLSFKVGYFDLSGNDDYYDLTDSYGVGLCEYSCFDTSAEVLAGLEVKNSFGVYSKLSVGYKHVDRKPDDKFLHEEICTFEDLTWSADFGFLSKYGNLSINYGDYGHYRRFGGEYVLSFPFSTLKFYASKNEILGDARTNYANTKFGLEYSNNLIYLVDFFKKTSWGYSNDISLTRRFPTVRGYTNIHQTTHISGFDNDYFAANPIVTYKNQDDSTAVGCDIIEKLKSVPSVSEPTKEYDNLSFLPTFGRLLLNKNSDSGESNTDHITNISSINIEWPPDSDAASYCIFIKNSKGIIRKIDVPPGAFFSADRLLNYTVDIYEGREPEFETYEIKVTSRNKESKCKKKTSTLAVMFIKKFHIGKEIVKRHLVREEEWEEKKEEGHFEYINNMKLDILVDTPVNFPLYNVLPSDFKIYHGRSYESYCPERSGIRFKLLSVSYHDKILHFDIEIHCLNTRDTLNHRSLNNQLNRTQVNIRSKGKVKDVAGNFDELHAKTHMHPNTELKVEP